jgi:hypothetical protein
MWPVMRNFDPARQLIFVPIPNRARFPIETMFVAENAANASHFHRPIP